MCPIHQNPLWSMSPLYSICKLEYIFITNMLPIFIVLRNNIVHAFECSTKLLFIQHYIIRSVRQRLDEIKFLDENSRLPYYGKILIWIHLLCHDTNVSSYPLLAIFRCFDFDPRNNERNPKLCGVLICYL